MATAKRDVLITTVQEQGAVVVPGITFVNSGETVSFINGTESEAVIRFADDRVVDCEMPLILAAREERSCEVLLPPPEEERICEYVVLVQLPGRKAFAVGASTPKIIIRPTRY